MKAHIIALVLLGAVSLSAQNHSMGTSKPATLVTGIGDAHHPVSTKNAEAQQFFDQGLRFIYAFNHDEAIRAFRRAAELGVTLNTVLQGGWAILLAKLTGQHDLSRAELRSQ